MNNRCSRFMWLSISSIINFYRLSIPIDQLIYIDCHRLVVLFYAFYLQSRFPKHFLFMHQIMMKTAIKLLFFHNGDWYIVENMGTRFYRTVAEWQRITNIPVYARTIKPAVNYIHFLPSLLYAPLLWQKKK